MARRKKSKGLAAEWQSSTERETGATRLRKALKEHFNQTKAQLDGVLHTGSSGLTARLLNTGELLLDLSCTPLGRVATAAAAVTLAWLLI